VADHDGPLLETFGFSLLLALVLGIPLVVVWGIVGVLVAFFPITAIALIAVAFGVMLYLVNVGRPGTDALDAPPARRRARAGRARCDGLNSESAAKWTGGGCCSVNSGSLNIWACDSRYRYPLQRNALRTSTRFRAPR